MAVLARSADRRIGGGRQTPRLEDRPGSHLLDPQRIRSLGGWQLRGGTGGRGLPTAVCRFRVPRNPRTQPHAFRRRLRFRCLRAPRICWHPPVSAASQLSSGVLRVRGSHSRRGGTAALARSAAVADRDELGPSHARPSGDRGTGGTSPEGHMDTGWNQLPPRTATGSASDAALPRASTWRRRA